MANRTKWTEEKRADFLEALKETGTVVKAASRVDMSTTRLYELRAEDDDLKKDWDEAQKIGDGVLLQGMEKECDRRAMKGTAKPVFYKGKAIGFVREYSDTLLMFRMKKLNPAYAKQVLVGDKEAPLRIRLVAEGEE